MATVTERLPETHDAAPALHPTGADGAADGHTSSLPPQPGDDTQSGSARPPMNSRRVLGLAVPIIGENLLQTAVGTVDTLMVARLGATAVAGVGTSVEVVFFMLATLSAIGIGATVLVAQAFGAGDRERVNRLARQALVWGVLLSVPVSIVGYAIAGRVIGLFGTEPDVAAIGTGYFRITAATSVVLLLTFVGGAVFRGVGDSRTPLIASVIANVINVFAAYGLIFGRFGLPELGVEGSAWGAATGRAVGALVLVALLLSGRRAVVIRGLQGWLPRIGTARQLLRLGIPAAVEEMLMSAGFMTLMAVVAGLGTASLAAQQIGFTALAIAFMPAFGFAIATTALVGQSIGAGHLDDARRATRIAMIWSTAWLLVGGVIYFVFARSIMTVFTDDADVIDAGKAALRALSFSLPWWAIWMVNGGALRGSGDARTPMIVSAISVWAAVGLAYGVVTWFDGGLGSVWLTFAITSPLGALGNWLLLRRRLAPGSPVLKERLGNPPPASIAGH